MYIQQTFLSTFYGPKIIVGHFMCHHNYSSKQSSEVAHVSVLTNRANNLEIPLLSIYPKEFKAGTQTGR